MAKERVEVYFRDGGEFENLGRQVVMQPILLPGSAFYFAPTSPPLPPSQYDIEFILLARELVLNLYF